LICRASGAARGREPRVGGSAGAMRRGAACSNTPPLAPRRRSPGRTAAAAAAAPSLQREVATNREARVYVEQGAHGASLVLLLACPSCFVAADLKDD
jgi:hypothetical protein